MAKRTRVADSDVHVSGVPPLSLPDGKVTPGDATALQTALLTLTEKINGGLSHGHGETGHHGNLDEQFVDVITPPTADLAFAVPHGLGRLAVGYSVVRRDRACSVYDGNQGSWSDTVIFLKCSVVSASLKLIIF